jgi:ankyrin repeat protein
MNIIQKVSLSLLIGFASQILAQTDTTTDLIIAAGHGDTHRVRQLLDQRVNVNLRDEDGFTALIFAAHSGNTETVKLLLNRGADANAKSQLLGYTALMNAAGFGDIRMLKALLDRGARINERNDDGVTALTIAEEGGKASNASFLREHGGRK